MIIQRTNGRTFWFAILALVLKNDFTHYHLLLDRRIIHHQLMLDALTKVKVDFRLSCGGHSELALLPLVLIIGFVQRVLRLFDHFHFQSRKYVLSF